MNNIEIVNKIARILILTIPLIMYSKNYEWFDWRIIKQIIKADFKCDECGKSVFEMQFEFPETRILDEHYIGLNDCLCIECYDYYQSICEKCGEMFNNKGDAWCNIYCSNECEDMHENGIR